MYLLLWLVSWEKRKFHVCSGILRMNMSPPPPSGFPGRSLQWQDLQACSTEECHLSGV